MTLDKKRRLRHHPTLGVDAVSLHRYSDVHLEEDDELIVYDERREDAWIQSSFWIQAESME